MQLGEHPILVSYVEHISNEVFSRPLPAAPPITSAEWAQRAENLSSSNARYTLIVMLKPVWARLLFYPQVHHSLHVLAYAIRAASFSLGVLAN